MNIRIKLNPEYAKLVLPLSEGEYQELKQSIKQNGLWHPITVNKKDIVLDGHHRYKACQELGIQPRIEYKSFGSILQEKLFVIDSNLKRRQLSTFARVELALSKKPILQEIARNNMALAGKGDRNLTPLGRVDDSIADSVTTSRDTVRKVEFLLENASAESISRLRQGKSRIFKEYKRTQRAIAIQKIRKSAVANSSSKNSFFNCKLGDIRKVGKQIGSNTIDLIFTDPPYKEEFLYLYGDLAKLAQRVLKPGASLVTYIGDYALPRIVRLIEDNSELEYHYRYVVKHNGHITRMWKHRVWPHCKLLLWYYKSNSNNDKGPTMFKDVNDLIESEPPKKDMHPWEQSPIEAEHVIRALTDENNIILDPFMGYASTGIASLQLNRKFRGIEIDEVRHNDACLRLSKLKASTRANKKC